METKKITLGEMVERIMQAANSTPDDDSRRALIMGALVQWGQYCEEQGRAKFLKERGHIFALRKVVHGHELMHAMDSTVLKLQQEMLLELATDIASCLKVAKIETDTGPEGMTISASYLVIAPEIVKSPVKSVAA